MPVRLMLRRLNRATLAQVRRSLYILAFQLPSLPERSLGREDGRALARALVGTSRPGTFSEADLAEYRRSWAGPNALRPMIDWYRAALRHPPARGNAMRIDVPTLLVWGAHDRFLGHEMARPSIELCNEGRLEVFESATHWLQHEEPDRVNALIDAFVGGAGPVPSDGTVVPTPGGDARRSGG